MNPGLFILTLLAASPPPLDGIAAVVGSVPVLHSDVVTILVESGVEPERARSLYRGDPLYESALSELTDEKLLVEAAKREGLYPSPAQVNQRVEAFLESRRADYPSEAAFLQALSASGVTMQVYREILTTSFAHRIAAENYVRRIGGIAGTSMPADPEAFIVENLDGFRDVMEIASVSWIYLPVLPGATAEAEDLLLQVRERIESGSADFDVMAMEHSQDGSARVGGDLGWFQPGDMTPAFEVGLRGLEPGEIGGPFVSPFGVHLVMVTEREEGRLRASHILRLVPLETADADSAMALAEEVLDMIRRGDATFRSAARAHSLDPESRVQGGELGTVPLSRWDERIRRVLDGLDPGGTSEPVFIEQGSAVAIFHLNEDQTPDFSGYSPAELEELVGAYLWERTFRETVNSLREEIPVYYPGS